MAASSADPSRSAAAATSPLGLRGLLRTGGFRRLLGVRLAAQWGDGMFQAALGGAVLFNPERQADPIAVAAGFAVLLLPYSVIGPFAGALLDRWDRRRVLLVANLVRAALVLVVAGCVFAGVAGVPLYVAALAVAGVARFVLSGLSAALPHVVPGETLVEANAAAVTAGAAVAALGGAAAIALRGLIGPGDAGSATVTAVAALGALLAALVAAGYRRRRLGPDQVTEPERTVAAVARGLADGARATVAAPTVVASFAALAAHRLAFGVTTLLTLLLFRYTFTGTGPLLGGFGGVGQAVALAAAGLGLAAVLTPWLVRRLGRARAVRLALIAAAAAQLGLGLLLTLPTLLVAVFLLATAGQVVKLCADAEMQRAIPDDVRGRVFAFYDAVFSICYVAAVTGAALLAPADGSSRWLLVSATGLYVLGLLAHDVRLPRARPARARGSRARLALD